MFILEKNLAILGFGGMICFLIFALSHGVAMKGIFWKPKNAVFSAEKGADRYRSMVSSSLRQGPVNRFFKVDTATNGVVFSS